MRDARAASLADKMVPAKNRERERERDRDREWESPGPLIAEILEVNWGEERADRTLARRNAFQLS